MTPGILRSEPPDIPNQRRYTRVMVPARRVTPRSAQLAAARKVKRLGRLLRRYGPGASSEKLELLEYLEHAVLPTPGGVRDLHEAACFLRAYPDSRQVLACVERILAGFADRTDLRRHKAALASTGMAGTDMHFAYYWFTACELARRWPELLSIEWADFDDTDALAGLLPLLALEHEALALEVDFTIEELVEAFKGRSETDAAWLLRAFGGMRADPLLREKLFDDLVLPLVLAAGSDTPSRTAALFPVRRIAFQTAPIARGATPARRAALEPPVGVRSVSRADGERLVWLAQESMMTRQRDLYAFIHASADDVLRVDYGAGLEFACIGLAPERRHLLYGTYVILALKNGVPVGYVQATTLFESAEINFNVFDTFRAAEASRIFNASLAMTRHLFGARTFAINTQQLGADNPEALATGAWWFYYKHGFRPDSAPLRRLAARELAARRRDPARRSSRATLSKLASEPLFLDLERRRASAIGRLSVAGIGLAVARQLSEHDSSREQLERRCSARAAGLLGIRDTSAWSRNQRLWWKRWAPMILALPGIEAWSTSERRALVRLVRAKAARRERGYVLLFDAHAPLRHALLRLARR